MPEDSVPAFAEHNVPGFAEWMTAEQATAGQEFLREVQAERYHQDRTHGGPAADDTHPRAFWTALIVGYANKALRVDADTFRQRMVQVAALALAAVQAYDRGALSNRPTPHARRNREG